MVINEPVAELPTTPTFDGAPLVPEMASLKSVGQRGSRAGAFMNGVRRRFVVAAGVIAIGAAIAFAFVG